MASSLGFGFSFIFEERFVYTDLFFIVIVVVVAAAAAVFFFFIQHFKYIVSLPSDPIVSGDKLALNLIKDYWYNNNYQNYYLSFFFFAA